MTLILHATAWTKAGMSFDISPEGLPAGVPSGWPPGVDGSAYVADWTKGQKERRPAAEESNPAPDPLTRRLDELLSGG